jgi:hypothetical protein
VPRNGSGVYSAPPGTTAVPNTPIESADFNSVVADVGQALTDSINVAGTAPWTANQPMGGFKFTGMGAGSAAGDSAKLSQVQDSIVSHATVVGGTVDAITLTFSPGFTAYTSNMRFRFTAGGANTSTTPTVNVDTLGLKTIKTLNGAALGVGSIAGSGHICDCVYNGTDVILLNPANNVLTTIFKLTGVISPAQITADQNNYAPTGFATNGIWRITTDGTTRTITGIDATAAGGSGGFLYLLNCNNSTAFILSDQNGGSSAANQIKTPNGIDYYVRGGGGVVLFRDATSSLWRIVQPFDPATQATMEAAASPASVVTPLNQHYHPGHPKVWGKASYAAGTPTLNVSYNVTSITDTGAGDLLVTHDKDFSSVHYAFIPVAETNDPALDAAADKPQAMTGAMTAGTAQIVFASDDTVVNSDNGIASVSFVGLGDQ